MTVSGERATTSPRAASTYSGRTCSASACASATRDGSNDELDDAAAVAQVDEDEVAVVAAARDPAGEADLAADVGGAQLAGIGVAQHQASFPRRAASSAARPAAASVLFPAAVHGAQADEAGAELVETEQHRAAWRRCGRPA